MQWTNDWAWEKIPAIMQLASDSRPEPLVGSQSGTDTERRDQPLLSFFIPRPGLGGAERVAITLVNGLSARGYNIELLVSQADGSLQSHLESQVNVVDLPPSWTPMVGVASHLPALIAYLRRKRPAALFPHLGRVNVVCLAAKRAVNTDTSIIPTHHKAFGVSSEQNLKARSVRWMVPHLYPSADRIIAVSNGVADSIVEHTSVHRDDISVLYNPIEIEEIQKQATEPVENEWINDDDTQVILFVGRLEEQKDLETWLRSFQRVHNRSPNTRGLIVGKGSQREHLLNFVEKLGMEDVISLPGFVENPYAYMRGADVFLLSSRYEGLPTVLIEALACGCSIVSTDCPSGPEEILVDGKYGRLAPVASPSAIADAVIETLGDPMDPDKLQNRANTFAPESVLNDYEDLIEEYILSS